MKYCECKEPKIVKSQAAGKTFLVCSINQGGCGEEYKEKKQTELETPNIEDILYDIVFDNWF